MVKVSIITVVLNNKAQIERTIRSVLGQSYENIEYIIIDGGSTDGTVEVIKQVENKLAFWVSEPDKNIFDAMNKGIRKASGELIGLLNSDDWLEGKDAIQKIVDCTRQNPDADVFHGNVYYHTEYGKKLFRPAKLNSRVFWIGIPVYQPTMYVRRHVYEELLYDMNYTITGDCKWVLEALQRGYKFHYLDEVITNFQAGGKSANCIFPTLLEGHRIRRELGYNPALTFLSTIIRISRFSLYKLKCIGRNLIGKEI